MSDTQWPCFPGYDGEGFDIFIVAINGKSPPLPYLPQTTPADLRASLLTPVRDECELDRRFNRERIGLWRPNAKGETVVTVLAMQIQHRTAVPITARTITFSGDTWRIEPFDGYLCDVFPQHGFGKWQRVLR